MNPDKRFEEEALVVMILPLFFFISQIALTVFHVVNLPHRVSTVSVNELKTFPPEDLNEFVRCLERNVPSFRRGLGVDSRRLGRGEQFHSPL